MTRNVDLVGEHQFQRRRQLARDRRLLAPARGGQGPRLVFSFFLHGQAHTQDAPALLSFADDAPGASLGGARPKANFTEQDGALWIGKFPARDDDRDIGAGEFVVHAMASQAGIDVPEARLVRLNNEFHTFCVKRFDRVGGKRRFCASAMTLLRREQDEGTSYLELAQFLRTSGDPQHVEADLAQLFRRVAFNVAVGNRDDHLRNHGFLLSENGWRVAPAFDVNPNIDKSDHVLNIDDQDNRPSLATVAATSAFYGLSAAQARDIIGKVVSVVDHWQDAARNAGIYGADIDITSGAFAAHATHHAVARG